MAELNEAWLRANAHALDERLHKSLHECLRRPERLPVLIMLRSNAAPRHERDVAEHARTHGGRIIRRLRLVKAVSAAIPAHLMPQVAGHPHVRKLIFDYEVYANLNVATPTVGAPQMWRSGLRGEGIGIAVIDTGIYSHPDFTHPENRIKGWLDLVNHRPQPYDDNGHGTHVAGIAAGNGTASRGLYTGVAPGASLIGVKALDRQGGGRLSTIIAGLQWVVEKRTALNIRVVNLSLGGQPPAGEDPMAQAAIAAWQAGLVVCAAAGNDGPNAGTVSTPGVAAPIITVGATDDHHTVDPAGNTIASFSSRGPTPAGVHKPDIVAPGVQITSTLAPGSVLAHQEATTPDQQYVTLSGTSMATPFCSGAAALLLQADPKLTPAALKERMVSSAVSLGLVADVQGAGLLEVTQTST